MKTNKKNNLAVLIKIYALIIFLLSCFVNCYSQKVDSDSLITNIKSEITKFFIDEGFLSKKDVGNSQNFVFANEIKEQKMLGYSINGVYRIGVFQSHSKQHILIKENTQFKIFDIKQINETLKEVIDFSTRNKVKADTMFFYLKEIMRMYDSN